MRENSKEPGDEQSVATIEKEKIIDESETKEINKLRRDIVTLQAEMKARSDIIEHNDVRMKILKSNIMKHLQQSLSDPLFESSSMSLLVMQLSRALSEDEYVRRMWFGKIKIRGSV